EQQKGSRGEARERHQLRLPCQLAADVGFDIAGRLGAGVRGLEGRLDHSQHCDSQALRLQGTFRSDTPCGWAVAPGPVGVYDACSVSVLSLEGHPPPLPIRLRPAVLPADVDGSVGVERLLLRFGVRVAALLRLADLDDVLLLTLSTAPGPAPAVTGGLGRRRILVRLALVPRLGVGPAT